MRRTYRPDSWTVVVIESAEHGAVYKILASWYGGFANGDSWKLSSGIEDVIFSDSQYTMPQSSGSTYIVTAGSEHVSSLMRGVFDSFLTDAEAGGFTIAMIGMDEFLSRLKANPDLLKHD